MANREIEAILKISSKLGSMRALQTLQREIGKVDKQAKVFNRTQSAIARGANSAVLASARFLGPAAIGYGAKRAFTQFASLERQLTRTGLKIGANRKEMADLNAAAMGVAQKYAVGNQAVTDTIDAYAETGAELKDIKADLDGLVKAQQAMGAEGRDVIGTWDAARKSFGLMSNDAERFFDIIAAGGNSGKFEGSDLAQYLPSLMPTAAVHGMGGLGGTAQIVGALEAMRDRTGKPEEAATALRDFMDKLNSPTVQKSFAKFNVDLPKALERARKDGVPLFKAMADTLQKVTGGNTRKLGLLFSERDSRAFALMLMQDIDGVLERIRKLRDESKGTIQINVDAVTKDAEAKIDRLSNSWDRLLKAAGAGLSDPVGGTMDKITEYFDYAAAVKRGLESEGRSGSDDYGLSPEERERYFRLGGGKTPADREAEAREKYLADANRTYSSAGRNRVITYAAGKDANGIPIPRKYVPGEYSNYGQVGLPQLSDVPPGLLPDNDPRRLRHLASQTMNGGNGDPSDGMIRMFNTEGPFADFEARLQAGGEAAGRSIQDAAQAINQAGQDGGNAFASMLAGVGQKIGAEAAAAFKANVGNLSIGVSGASRVNADVGRSGPAMEGSQ